MEQEFNIEYAIKNYINSLSNSGSISYRDTKEIEQHLYDSVEDLKKKDLNTEEAFAVAKLRMGSEKLLKNEYKKINTINMTNKEWVFIFVGILITIFTYNILEIVKIKISQLVLSNTVSTSFAAFFLAFVHAIISISCFLLISKGEILISFCKNNFIDQKKYFTAIFSLIACVFLFIPFQKIISANYSFIAIDNTYTSIIYHNRFTELIIRGSLPITLIISTTISLQSVNKKLDLKTVFESNNYLYILLLGAGVEVIAAIFGRMFYINSITSFVLYFISFTSLFTIFLAYNKTINISKVIVFNLLAFYTENLSGYFQNGVFEDVGRFNSLFSWAYIFSITVGLGLYKFLKSLNKETKLTI